MAKYYTDEKNAQVVLALLKAHNIRKVVVSPGATNVRLVASMQGDSFFQLYSSVDERSAAYIACGLAAESGEPVVLSCTGATASRNYFPGITEAYYRKLPILAITSTQSIHRIGHHIPQVIDRSIMPKDTYKHSVSIPNVNNQDDFWNCEIKINEAILELYRNGGGPVHINLPTTYSRNFDVKELPNVRVINRITASDNFPVLPIGKVAIFIGSHAVISEQKSELIDHFCESNNGAVFCDHTSNYKGKFRILFPIAGCQKMFDSSQINPDVFIHIGEISGDSYTPKIQGKEVWRVSEDGEIRDTFRKLRYIFEMTESEFFGHYAKTKNAKSNSYLELCQNYIKDISKKFPDIPFSNIWVASQIAHQIPQSSVIHFGILNSLRSWNFFEIPNSVTSASNVGGFGIDGCVSSLIGASLCCNDKLYFAIVGDLAFFYDMNALGNRHVGNNLRLMIVNNGTGTEFKQFNHPASDFGKDTDDYIAASGHYGNKSKTLVKDYVENLGFEYISASSKEEFGKVYKRFLEPEITAKPIVFEVFTNSEDESVALEKIMSIEENLKGKAKQVAKQVLGKNSLGVLKKAIRK